MTVSLQISYTLWEWPSILGDRKPRCWDLFLPSFSIFLFSISHSHVIHREICVKDFSGTTAPRILKLGIHIGYDLLYCVKENQHAAAYHSPYLCIFLSLQAKFSVTNFLASMRARVFKFRIHIESGQVYCGTENKTQIYFALFLLFSISHSNVST